MAWLMLFKFRFLNIVFRLKISTGPPHLWTVANEVSPTVPNKF